ncbi:hypothetical protein ACHAXN_006976 [Cyclotella atomus]|jgi:hypothetical protein
MVSLISTFVPTIADPMAHLLVIAMVVSAVGQPKVTAFTFTSLPSQSLSDRPIMHNSLSADPSPPRDGYIYTKLGDLLGNAGNPQSRRDLQQVLTVIESAAYAAGEITLATVGKIAIKSTKTNTRDLVTESDVACQALIKKIITNDFPNDVFLGEEDVDLVSDGGAVALKKALGSGNIGDDPLLFVVVRI